MALLHVVPELALILAAVDVGVLAVAVGHVIPEVAAVDVALSVPEGALAVGAVELPLALVVRAVIPVLDAVAMPHYFRDVLVLLLLALTIVGHQLIELVVLGGEPHLQPSALVTGGVVRETLQLDQLLAADLVHLLHLAAVDRVVLVDEAVHVLQSRLVLEEGQEQVVGLHGDLVVGAHRVSDRRSLLDEVVAALLHHPHRLPPHPILQGQLHELVVFPILHVLGRLLALPRRLVGLVRLGTHCLVLGRSETLVLCLLLVQHLLLFLHPLQLVLHHLVVRHDVAVFLVLHFALGVAAVA
uniref:Uncharacterized protein n=1 Tax=Strombidium rassoulzadegani TaxID=1082188 RepID=A0A7S3CI36_9SPIT|mmetsp:Transcript_1055/g.1947  ORF Transcript_1055/g.1947 Transcript_1055/m.1947 type:complete len:299 (+) Transcript_1055:494-1390(+)